jgi:ribulose-phosphate 3-epimerase
MLDLSLVYDLIDLVIFLSTEPESSDCPFIPAVLNKIREVNTLPFRDKFECMIDGGVSLENIPDIHECGADSIVVGRFTFQDGNIHENISRMRKLIEDLEPN